MYRLFAERRFVMAVVADVGLIGHQELRRVRRMGVVAAGAAHAERGVHVLLREHALVMAVVADVGLIGDEEL